MRRWISIASLALCLGFTVSACQRGPESTGAEERAGEKPRPQPANEADSEKAVRVPLLGAKMKGSDEALVTVVEFSDYQCPYCKKAHETVESLLGQYGDKVRLAVFERPLPFHTLATPAAKWAYAAGEQGKYWQARDMLFERQRSLGEEGLAEMAKSLGLDAEKLERDRKSEAAERAVKAGLELAEGLDVQGTPTFFVNGRRIVGAQPVEKFRAAIDAAAKEAEAMVARGVKRRDVYAEVLKNAAAPGAKQVRAANTAERGCKDDCGGEPAGPPAADDKVVDVEIGAAPSRGPSRAPVTIVVFTDFECPFCRKAEETLKSVEAQYKGQVRVVYKGYPLPFHEHARPAMKAALAAHKQGKFFEYRDALFEHQEGLDRDALIRYAGSLGLDAERFARDMDDPATEAAIAADEAQAHKLDVQGTPTFFVNGRRVRGAQPAEAFREAINRSLAGK